LFGTSPVFWINLQGHYDLEEVEEEKIGETALAEIQPFAHA
jgi:plasmid maintenance system antidote protein VapI